MIRIFNESGNESAYDCKVIQFRFGSVIAEYQLLMDPDDSNINTDYVEDVIQTAIYNESLDYITPAKDSLVVEGKYKKQDGIVTFQSGQYNFLNWPIAIALV